MSKSSLSLILHVSSEQNQCKHALCKTKLANYISVTQAIVQTTCKKSPRSGERRQSFQFLTDCRLWLHCIIWSWRCGQGKQSNSPECEQNEYLFQMPLCLLFTIYIRINRNSVLLSFIWNVDSWLYPRPHSRTHCSWFPKVIPYSCCLIQRIESCIEIEF